MSATSRRAGRRRGTVYSKASFVMTIRCGVVDVEFERAVTLAVSEALSYPIPLLPRNIEPHHQTDSMSPFRKR